MLWSEIGLSSVAPLFIAPFAFCFVQFRQGDRQAWHASCLCVCCVVLYGPPLQEAVAKTARIQEEFENGGQDEDKKRHKVNRVQSAVSKVRCVPLHSSHVMFLFPF